MQDIAHHDFAFEDIIDDSEQQLKILAEALGVSHKVQHFQCFQLIWPSWLKNHNLNQDRSDHQQVLFKFGVPAHQGSEIYTGLRLQRDNLFSRCQFVVLRQRSVMQVDIKSVAERVDALESPAGGPPDPVTKLWPRHMSQAVQQKQDGMASSKSGEGRGRDLKDRFPPYFEVYGYN